MQPLSNRKIKIMARNNDLTPEEMIDNFAPLSGKFKNIVFYNLNGNTFYRKAPGPYKPPTGLQLEKRNKFREAIAYAKIILQDPAVKAVYLKRAKPGQTAHNVAIREYMRGNSL